MSRSAGLPFSSKSVHLHQRSGVEGGSGHLHAVRRLRGGRGGPALVNLREATDVRRAGQAASFDCSMADHAVAQAQAVSDEERRKREKPALEASEAEALATRLWGLRLQFGATTRLNSYDDANFRLADEDGTLFVLKVHNGVESSNRAFVEAQNDAMELVRSQACWCPSALPSLAGRTIELATLASSGGREHAIRLLPYKRARLQADVDPTPTSLWETGAMLGRVTKALTQFSHPATVREHAWDVVHFASTAPPLIRAVPDEANRKLVTEVLRRFNEHVAPVAPRLRRQVIHGDMNDQNVLIAEDSTEPAGIIDFGDLVQSWRVADAAIACAYLLIQLHYKEAAARTLAQVGTLCTALLTGFASECELTGDEWAVLPTLVLARISTSLVFGAYSASLEPNNEYLTLTQAPGWMALRLLLSIQQENLGKWLVSGVDAHCH